MAKEPKAVVNTEQASEPKAVVIRCELNKSSINAMIDLVGVIRGKLKEMDKQPESFVLSIGVRNGIIIKPHEQADFVKIAKNNFPTLTSIQWESLIKSGAK